MPYLGPRTPPRDPTESEPRMGAGDPTRYKFQDRGLEPSRAAMAEPIADRTGDPTSDRIRTPDRIPVKARVIKYVIVGYTVKVALPRGLGKKHPIGQIWVGQPGSPVRCGFLKL